MWEAARRCSLPLWAKTELTYVVRVLQVFRSSAHSRLHAKNKLWRHPMLPGTPAAPKHMMQLLSTLIWIPNRHWHQCQSRGRSQLAMLHLPEEAQSPNDADREATTAPWTPIETWPGGHICLDGAFRPRSPDLLLPYDSCSPKKNSCYCSLVAEVSMREQNKEHLPAKANWDSVSR